MAIPRRGFARSAVGLAGLGSTAGCLDALSNPEPAFLSYKAITVRWRRDRTQGYVADLCWLWSDGRSRIFGWAPEAYPDVVRSPTEVTLPERTFRRLRDRFAGVELVLGFSRADTTDLALLESDLGQVAVSRDRFNRVQFGDRITVARTESGVRVRDVEDAAHGDPTGWTVQIGTKDLVSQFPDSRVPEPT
ncbi:MAG: hypothetical protein ACOC06_03425 [Halorubrum sp.]